MVRYILPRTGVDDRRNISSMHYCLAFFFFSLEDSSRIIFVFFVGGKSCGCFNSSFYDVFAIGHGLVKYVTPCSAREK